MSHPIAEYPHYAITPFALWPAINDIECMFLRNDRYARLPLAILAALALFSFLLTRPASASIWQHWQWPTGNTVSVTRGFDPPALRWLSGHRGVDLKVDAGATIYAPADGIVEVAGEIAGKGVVSLSHGPVRSTYEPVDALVNVGDHVSAGTPIATLRPGHEPAGGLHWGAKTSRDHYVDPLRFLVGNLALKPWDGSK